MPADALTYEYLSKELDSALSGGVIAKISMPYPDEIVLAVRNAGRTHQLLLSASPACPRVHLTEARYTGLPAAPAFLMHLRKHIGSARILGFDAVPFERVLRVRLSSRNELGDEETKTLYAEIMGKYSNLILVNGDGRVSDSIRRVTPDLSSKRQILPGLVYSPAPPQAGKTDISRPALIAEHLAAFPGGRVAPYIIRRLSGLSPATVNECVYRALGRESADALDKAQIDAIVRQLQAFYDFSSAEPCVMTSDGVPVDFCVRPYLTEGDGSVRCATLSEAMERYYYALDRKNRFDAQAHALVTAVKAALKRAENRLDESALTRERSADYEHEQRLGEFITANIYRLKKNMTAFTADNYYTGETVSIPLDPALSPQMNAQRYYKRAAKKKKAFTLAETQMREAAAAADYLRSVLAEIANGSDPADLIGIRAELVAAGIVRAPAKAAGKKPTPGTPMTFKAGGFTVRVGRNNLQNDALTRAARPDDIWLHTQKIHGSHTVIAAEGRAVPDEVIRRAAEICAFHSAARQSDNVPVDYTFAKYVHKPAGARPGMVVYTDQRTVYVKPQEGDTVVS